jgi:D-alanine-D-alanine ligase
VLIEAAITGRELEVAVLGNPPYHQASGVGEVIPPEGDFYSYDAKYASGGESKVIVSPDINPEKVKAIRIAALKAYEILGCKGLSRVDFFLQDDGQILINEVNTLPGFTNISMYPKLWREENISYPELIERFISLAIRGTMKANQTEE